jgi:hypothetical protein
MEPSQPRHLDEWAGLPAWKRRAVYPGMLLATLGIFALSLPLRAVQVVGFMSGVNWQLGWEALAWGAVSLLAGCPSWLANPAFVVGAWQLARGRGENAAVLGSFALLLAVSPFLIGWHSHVLYGSMDIVARGSGYWVWLAAMVALIGFGFADSAIRSALRRRVIASLPGPGPAEA